MHDLRASADCFLSVLVVCLHSVMYLKIPSKAETSLLASAVTCAKPRLHGACRCCRRTAWLCCAQQSVLDLSADQVQVALESRHSLSPQQQLSRSVL